MPYPTDPIAGGGAPSGPGGSIGSASPSAGALQIIQQTRNIRAVMGGLPLPFPNAGLPNGGMPPPGGWTEQHLAEMNQWAQNMLLQSATNSPTPVAPPAWIGSQQPSAPPPASPPVPGDLDDPGGPPSTTTTLPPNPGNDPNRPPTTPPPPGMEWFWDTTLNRWNQRNVTPAAPPVPDPASAPPPPPPAPAMAGTLEDRGNQRAEAAAARKRAGILPLGQRIVRDWLTPAAAPPAGTDGGGTPKVARSFWDRMGASGGPNRLKTDNGPIYQFKEGGSVHQGPVVLHVGERKPNDGSGYATDEFVLADPGPGGKVIVAPRPEGVKPTLKNAIRLLREKERTVDKMFAMAFGGGVYPDAESSPDMMMRGKHKGMMDGPKGKSKKRSRKRGRLVKAQDGAGLYYGSDFLIPLLQSLVSSGTSMATDLPLTQLQIMSQLGQIDPRALGVTDPEEFRNLLMENQGRPTLQAAQQQWQQQFAGRQQDFAEGSYDKDRQDRLDQFLKSFGLDTRRQDFSELQGERQYGLDKDQLALSKLLGLGDLDVRRQGLQVQSRGIEGDLAERAAMRQLQEKLGLGELEVKQLLAAIQGRDVDSQISERAGRLGLDTSRLGLDTELGRGGLQLGRDQLAQLAKYQEGQLGLEGRRVGLEEADQAYQRAIRGLKALPAVNNLGGAMPTYGTSGV